MRFPNIQGSACNRSTASRSMIKPLKPPRSRGSASLSRPPFLSLAHVIKAMMAVPVPAISIVIVVETTCRQRRSRAGVANPSHKMSDGAGARWAVTPEGSVGSDGTGASMPTFALRGTRARRWGRLDIAIASMHRRACSALEKVAKASPVPSYAWRERRAVIESCSASSRRASSSFASKSSAEAVCPTRSRSSSTGRSSSRRAEPWRHRSACRERYSSAVRCCRFSSRCCRAERRLSKTPSLRASTTWVHSPKHSSCDCNTAAWILGGKPRSHTVVSSGASSGS
mmetsp:Transcript_3794/g.11172  ORF Transcript_3794/g.11172 Transcript_3794/m.11172 type:complete len:284 (-) Transcript_3794:437-1288(-)